MKATEQNFSSGTAYCAVHRRYNFWICESIELWVSVVLFVMLNKVVLTFVSVDEILKSDHSTEIC